MTNVLFLAFEYPPLAAGGVHRAAAIARYLPRHGLQPIVVTLDPASYTARYGAHRRDETLSAPDAVRVPLAPLQPRGRLGTFTSIYFSIHGNEAEGWRENLFRTVDELVRVHRPRALLVTVPPFAMLPLAHELGRRHALPVIIDFRDAWSQWRMTPYGTRLHYLATLAYERRYLTDAAAIIATSRQTIADFQRLHQNVPRARFHYVPNGYEGEQEGWRSLDPTKPITIGYVGSFYYDPAARAQMLAPSLSKRGHRKLQYVPHRQDWLYRSPWFFFRALAKLDADVRVVIAGPKHAWLDAMIDEHGVRDRVQLVGELSHAASLELQRSCDALLLTSAKQLGARDYSIAGKTFEYLKVGRPIIAFVCEGAQRDLLEESGRAVICDPDEGSGLADFLAGRITLEPRPIDHLSREATIATLATVVQSVLR